MTEHRSEHVELADPVVIAAQGSDRMGRNAGFEFLSDQRCTVPRYSLLLRDYTSGPAGILVSRFVGCNQRLKNRSVQNSRD